MIISKIKEIWQDFKQVLVIRFSRHKFFTIHYRYGGDIESQISCAKRNTIKTLKDLKKDYYIDKIRGVC